MLNCIKLASSYTRLLVFPCACCPGPHSNRRPEEDSRCPSALHHPQHHRAGQALPDVPRPCPGRPAGRTGQPGPAAEHPQPERGAGHRPEGRREAREEEKEETEQPQSFELLEEEEERRPNTATEEDGGGGEEEKKSTQEKTRRHVRSCSYKYIVQQEDRDLSHLVSYINII